MIAMLMVGVAGVAVGLEPMRYRMAGFLLATLGVAMLAPFTLARGATAIVVYCVALGGGHWFKKRFKEESGADHAHPSK